ncbi:MAG TPA: ATP-grasp domain-containing protein [Nocardioidaceae bacterium]|nr:ATP-grasp domain-containing protein [Nocardioidaceae bacterium]
MIDVLLVTCAAWPAGEPGGELVVRELADRGVSAAWVAWDDPGVDWAEARRVLIRSTWDYERRRDEFIDWARKVQQLTTLVNTAQVVEWNTDKIYLLDLIEAELPVVPTLGVDSEFELAPAVATFEPAVVKPRVGAGGRGVVVFDLEPGGPEGLDESQLQPGPWVVQPLVESVHTEGETSVFVLGGRVVSQVRKLPAAGEIRVHEEYGGTAEAVEVTAEAGDLALRTVEVAEKLLATVLPYARVDLMRLADGQLVVSELEVVEPGLYLDVVPGNAAAFADVVADLLA